MVADVCLQAQSVPTCATRLTVPFLGSQVQVSCAPCVFIAVVTFKLNLLSVSQDDNSLVNVCGDKKLCNFSSCRLLIFSLLSAPFLGISSIVVKFS